MAYDLTMYKKLKWPIWRAKAREKLLQTVKLRYVMRKATMTWRSNMYYIMF